MFLNLTPYLTWLGIMMTSKPNDLQNRINKINAPAVVMTPPPTPITTTSTPSPTTIPIWDFFICTGRPSRRYPHTRDCSKYFQCTGEHEIIRPTSCPKGLHFSPIVLLCTVPREAGCTIVTPTRRPPGGGANNATSTSTTSTTTQRPVGSTWLSQIQLARYYEAVNEDRLVMYYDHDIQNPQSITWPVSFTRVMWNSIIGMYGNFGDNNRLYVLLRGRAQSEILSYSGYLDSSRGHLNTIEVGSSNWTLENANNTDLLTRNLAYIVAENARGIRYPGQAESNWADIFVYDLYERASRASDRDRWEAQVKEEAENDIANIPLFGEWYLPIYRMYGGGSILNRFFIVREQNFPRSSTNQQTFTRLMNRGELIHFWSGSCGANLTTTLVPTVFGWGSTLRDQYLQAVADFRNLSY